MKRKTIVRTLLPCLTLVICLTLCCGFVFFAGADSVLPQDPELKSEYTVGDTVSLGKIGIEDGGKQYEATPVVYAPNGDVSTSSEYTISYPGEYTVEYVASINGKTHKKSYTFQSKLKAYSTTNGSPVEYGTRTKKYLAGYLSSPFNKTAADTYDVTKTGIFVNLASNDTFTYNKVINLEELQGKPFLTFTCLPEEAERDAQFIDITLTDAYDPTIVMSIQISTGQTNAASLNNPNSWTVYSYLMAKTGQQIYMGLSDGVPQYGTNNHIYGSLARFGMYGNRSGRNWATEEYLSLSYDYEEKQLSQKSYAGKYVVCDFDNPQQYTTLFEGFTTNEVILSISTRNCYTSAFKFVITEIGNDDLSKEYVEDYSAPTLSVQDYSAPERAIKGVGYPVPTATAACPYSGDVDVEVKAYFAYGSNSQFDVPIKNGYIYPEYVGRYTLIYTAKGVTGVTATKRIDIQAENTVYKKLSIADLADKTQYVGETVKLVAPTVTGGIGEVKTEATVCYDGKTVDVVNNSFVPYSAGNYTIEWKATDVLGRTETVAQVISVAYTDEPIIDTASIVLPKCFIKGYNYTLPDVKAYVYSAAGTTEVSTEISATNGSVSSVVFTPTAEGTATVKYTASNGGKTREVEYSVPVIDVSSSDGISIAKYFVTDNFTANATDNNIEFTVTDTAKKSTLEFANKFVADGFYTTMSIPSTVADGMKLNVSLDDIGGDGNVTLTLIKSSTGIMLNYGGAVKYTYALTDDISLTYSRAENSIYVSNSTSFTLDGFDGFKSGYLYFSLNIVEGCENAGVCISSLSGQGINNLSYDNVRPSVAAEYDYEFDGELNGTVTIYKALSADVLDPITQATVTVRNPNGEYVTAKDGTLLQTVSADRTYEIVTDIYGYYTIRYDVTASNGQTHRETYSVLITDREAPTLKITDKIPASVKVGDTWKFSKYEVSDNLDDAKDVTVMCVVSHPHTHDITVLRSGNSFTFTKTGKYVLSFMAVDTSGNVTTIEYEITVL